MAKPSVEDRLAIEDLLVRYTTALDEGDVEGVVGCFIEDGRLDSPIIGRHEGGAALRAFAADIAGRRRRGAQFRHVVSNFRIDVSGDRVARAAISWTSRQSQASPRCSRPANTIANSGKLAANGCSRVDW